jgi:hypothetical protein
VKAFTSKSRTSRNLSPSRYYASQEQALRAESKKRLQLENRGYKVDGGTERLELLIAKRTKVPDRPTDTFA